jgi:hypothetical protein
VGHALTLVFVYATLITTPGIGWDMWLLYAVGLEFISDDFVFGPAPMSDPILGAVPSHATE